MLSIQITDLISGANSCLRHSYGFLGAQHLIIYFRALDRSLSIPRYALILVQPAKHPMLTAYAAVILLLPSDFALLLDIESLYKRKALKPYKANRLEHFHQELLASSSFLFPFVVYIISHIQGKVNNFFLCFSIKQYVFHKRKSRGCFTSFF